MVVAVVKPVDQTQFYSEELGTHGNCQQAATASLLELSLDEVPNFMALQLTEGEGHVPFWKAFNDFVQSRGFIAYERHGEWYDDGKKYATPTFRGYYLAYGPSARGVDHAVVYCNGKLVHDPHPSRKGIERVDTICLLVPLDPAAMVLRKPES